LGASHLWLRTFGESSDLLQRNNHVADEIGSKGTPTTIWQKPDGTAGRIDGIPKDWSELTAQVEGRRRGSRAPSASEKASRDEAFDVRAATPLATMQREAFQEFLAVRRK
jgi:hypothetical protein